MTRFAQPGRHWYAIYASIALMATLGLASVLIQTIACGTNDSYHYNLSVNQDKCPNLVRITVQGIAAPLLPS